jgi:hypothetical protein
MSVDQTISLKGLGRFSTIKMTAREIVAKRDARVGAVMDNFFGPDWDNNTVDMFRDFIPGLEQDQRRLANRNQRLYERLGVNPKAFGL